MNLKTKQQYLTTHYQIDSSYITKGIWKYESWLLKTQFIFVYISACLPYDCYNQVFLVYPVLMCICSFIIKAVPVNIFILLRENKNDSV